MTPTPQQIREHLAALVQEIRGSYYPPRILRGLRPAVELALKHEMFFKRTIFLLLTD